MESISFRVDKDVKDYLVQRYEESEFTFFSEYMRRMTGLGGVKYPKLNLSSKDKKVASIFYLIYSLFISLEYEMMNKVKKSPEHKEDMYGYWKECVSSLRIVLDMYINEIDREGVLNSEEDDLSSDIANLISAIFERENDNGGSRSLKKLKKVIEKEFNLRLKKEVT